MRYDTPLRQRHQRYVEQAVEQPTVDVAAANRPGAASGQRVGNPEVEYIPYGPREESGDPTCEIAAAYTDVEVEYAAIRRGAALMDLPQQGTIKFTGSERHDFLNRMLTNELSGLDAGRCVQSFWLNRKGRIESDLLLMEHGEALFAALSAHQAAQTIESLDSFLFTEDVEIADVSDSIHQLAIHGKRATEVLAAACGDESCEVGPGQCVNVEIAGASVLAARHDPTGEPGMTLLVLRDQVEAVWDALLATDDVLAEGKRRIRPVGWYAFNIARIEAGTPLFNIDFGTNNLPHESGLLAQRVSFTKGCFLGQEVVARMENLGRPKQTLIGFKCQGELLPVSGAQVFDSGSERLSDPIGTVTSSTLSPMLGAASIGFLMMKTAKAQVGATVRINAEGGQVDAELTSLWFWSPDEQASGATS